MLFRSDHSADTFTKALGIPDGETQEQLNNLSDILESLESESDVKINRSRLAELMVQHVDKRSILLFATEYVISRMADDPMEAMLKGLQQMKDALKD